MCEIVTADLGELLDGLDDDFLEGLAPNRVELVYFLVLLNCELSQVAYKALSSFGILFSLQPIVLDLLLSVFFALVTVGLLLDFRREDCWSRQDFVEVLELLPGFLLV